MDGKGIANHLSGWDDREKITAAEQVTQLLQHPGWEFVLASIKEYERTLIAGVVSSPQDSIEKYAHRSGQIKGLREVEQIAHGLVKAGKDVEDRHRAQEVGT